MGQTATATDAAAGASTTAAAAGPAAVATLSDEEIKAEAAASFCRMTAEAGRFVQLSVELARREGFRSDGATSIETWMVERTGMSMPSARAYAQVGKSLAGLPHLAAALCEGTLSFDKVRAVAPLANAGNDEVLAQRAKELSVRELVELARSTRPPSAADDDASHERRSLRLNETLRTMTAQLPEALFAEVRGALEARAAEVPSDGETPYDQRLADALVSLVRAGSTPGRSLTLSPYTVVAHVPFEALGDEDAHSALFGELERGGLISASVAQELPLWRPRHRRPRRRRGPHHVRGAGQTPGQRHATPRSRRRDRCCRFPGCAHVRFAIPHHIEGWRAQGGPTDLENLALLCSFHHGLVHRNVWTMRGNANEELTFVGPSGRVMTSRPSPLWVRVTTQQTGN